ncbi:flagellar hook-associated protein FlgK [Pokkaliibacter plantistimulans]|uniref:Flagellar hook-associated protein 1 n=1 Tax=Proteobacteria bacterium 228 TaxID=2083153 RepID=A0A2S5KVC8_9PROT|nr:flagellar hook-associated protein FlgK [Pokkaliibacter plantistimulans]PPC78459.1 flagellar hook-associated protein FlgK [Pokkaliibacter plantistimulans]
MSSSLINIGMQGVRASQAGLAVTSTNISNINSQGYSRQTVTQYSSATYGVTTSSVSRIADQYAVKNLQTQTSVYQESSTKLQLSNVLDELISGSTNSISDSISSFFASVNDAISDPSDTTSRSLVLSNAQELSGVFNQVNDTLLSQQSDINDTITSSVTSINSLTTSLADLNSQISSAYNQGQSVPDLEDQRDEVIRQLSEQVGVYTADAENGMVNVYLNGGDALVAGVTSTNLNVVQGEYDKNQLDISIGNSTTSISSKISGGSLGGAIEYRDEILNPTINQVGQLAMTFSESVNSVLEQGVDLNGDAGQALFDPALSGSYTVSNRVLASSNNDGSASGTLTFPTGWDPSTLTSSDYSVRYDSGTGEYTITRSSDGSEVASGAGPDFTVDGFDLSFSGTPSDGDTFLIRPTYSFAGELSTTDITSQELAFAASGSTTDVSGDNSNGQLLADLQNSSIVDGSLSFEGAYSQIIGDVGGYASKASMAEESNATLLSSAQDIRDSVSGVSEDEEAANLIKFQQAYQAAAQVISAAQQAFSTLLSAIS